MTAEDPASTRPESNLPPRMEEQLSAERALLRRYAAERSPQVREELVHASAARSRSRLATREGPSPLDDLVQVASVGLVKAIDRFDPERGTAFSTFAVPTILGELKRHFRDRGWSVHVPRDVQERILKVERALAELPASSGRAPTVSDIAERLGLSDEEVLEAMHASQGHHAVSLGLLVTVGDADEPAPLGDRIGADDLGFDTVEYGAAIEPTLRAISERDRMVLHLRFVEDLTQSEIAEQVGVSQMHVSRILRATARAPARGRPRTSPGAGPQAEACSEPTARKRGTRRSARPRVSPLTISIERASGAASPRRRAGPSAQQALPPPSTRGPTRRRGCRRRRRPRSRVLPSAKSSPVWAETASPIRTVSERRSTGNSARAAERTEHPGDHRPHHRPGPDRHVQGSSRDRLGAPARRGLHAAGGAQGEAHPDARAAASRP